MPVMESAPGPETIVDGRRYLYFAGTGYLGLQGHPAVIAAAAEASRRYGIGSATTRAWFGSTPPLVELESLAARFFSAEEAVVLPSGYLGNLAMIQVLRDSFEVVFLDELAHASLEDAARVTGKPVVRFASRDLAALEKSLAEHLPSRGRPLLATDGVFSVLGVIPPLDAYLKLLSKYPRSGLLVDDAHGVGVLGAHGRGTLEELGVLPSGGNRDPSVSITEWPAVYLTTTLSKALGGFGGLLPGAASYVQRLRSLPLYAGASGLCVPAAAASAKAVEIVMALPELRAALHRNVTRLKNGLRQLGLEVEENRVPIVALRLGDAQRTQQIQQELARQGILVAYAHDYRGAGPGGLIRIAVFANHTLAMIDRLLDTLRCIL